MKYSSDSSHPPIEFYLEAFSRATNVWLKLGYFSSQAFRSISYGFAQFVANGGRLKLVTNHHLYDQDKDLIFDYESPSTLDLSLVDDLSWMTDALSSSEQQFVACLKLLILSGRVEIVPVMLKPGCMAHYKEGVFEDDYGNLIHTNGSANFTGRGILFNGESLTVRASWLSDLELNTAQAMRSDIESIVAKSNAGYHYLSRHQISDQIVTHGPDYSVTELLRRESSLLAEFDSRQVQLVEKLLSRHRKKLESFILEAEKKPKFPYPSGPHAYQSAAKNAWLENNMRGIFAMATGTGKTITALNCALSLNDEEGCYQIVILVPYNNLVAQWAEEIRKFNFKSPISITSKNPKWRGELKQLVTRLGFNPKLSFSIVSTYEGAKSEDAKMALKSLGNNTLLIADEAHNAGAAGTRKMLAEMPFERRVALSATLTRRFDDEGNQFVEDFFGSSPPYTFEYPMAEALNNGVLCKYGYQPILASLNGDEMDAYRAISKELAKLFDYEKGIFWNPDKARYLLLERARIVHKAESKIACFLSACSQIMKMSNSLKYTFVYVPEGNDNDGDNLLEQYMDAFQDRFPNIRCHHYTHQTEERENILELFSRGVIDVIFSMKCLDEGVDIPRAENAIFCSSTGNPRQFIQRRGRILRKHPEKPFARVFDLVVVPNFTSPSDIAPVDRKLMLSELARVIDFANLADNYFEATEALKEVCKIFDINIHALEENIWEVGVG